MNRRNFSVNAGSSPESTASARSRAIWAASRSRSAGGSPTLALWSPTAWVILNRSASRCTRAASMLSMLARYRSSCSSLMGNRNRLRRATLPEHGRGSGVRYGPPTMDDTALPVLFFDGGLPDLYRDLIEGRAIAVGPDDADIALA